MFQNLVLNQSPGCAQGSTDLRAISGYEISEFRDDIL